jgi:hypothetical protein
MKRPVYVCINLVHQSMFLRRKKQSCMWKGVFGSVHALQPTGLFVTTVFLKMNRRVRNMYM